MNDLVSRKDVITAIRVIFMDEINAILFPVRIYDKLSEAIKNLTTVHSDSYRTGQWDMFVDLTSQIYGKTCYFKQENGVIYSRVSGKYLSNDNEAYLEWADYYNREERI